MDTNRLRAWWAARQALPNGMVGASPSAVLERSGWARSVGGANPYLTLFSRAGTSRTETEAALANMEVHELPSARGCTHLVPRSHFALALKVGQGFGEAAQINGARKYLGVTDAEIERLCERVCEALDHGPKDPSALKEAVGDAIRHLGAEGKKRGLTTTLPLALGRLQSLGEIRRQPVNGRLDQQRYAYVRWPDNPLKGFGLSQEEAYTELARLYFRWIGPASMAHFQWFSGLGAKASKAAVAPLDLVPVEETSLLAFPDDLEALIDFQVPTEPEYALVSGLDSIALHRREVASMLDQVDLTRKMTGSRGVFDIGGLQDLSSNAILDRGRIVGLWEFEVASQSIVWWSFVTPDTALREAVARTEAFVRDQLGDARSFSLDSPESRKPLIAALRESAEREMAVL